MFSFSKFLFGNVCWLVGSWLSVSSVLRPDLRFMAPMAVIWHAWCLYFGVPGDPGTILARSWDIREYKEGLYEVKFWILLPILQVCWVLLDKKLLLLFIFGSESGCPGSQKQEFYIEVIAKINFRRNWISYDSRVDFNDSNLHGFCCLENWFENF